MNKEQIIERLLIIMHDNNYISDINSVDLNDSLDVYGFDSISIVELIVLLEAEFDFEFDDADLDLSNFESIKSVVNIISNRLYLLNRT